MARLTSVMLLVCAIIAVLFILDGSTSVGAAELDLMSMFSKLPAMLPFLVAKIETESCKRSLMQFKKDVEASTKGMGEGNKNYIPRTKEALCKVPSSCIGEALGVVKGMVKSGGLMEKVAKTFLEGKGLDVDTVDVLIAAYVENLCNGSGESDEDIAAMLDEL